MNGETRRPRMRGLRRGVRVLSGRGGRGGPNRSTLMVEDTVVVAERGGPSGRGRGRGGRVNVRHERPGPSTIDELIISQIEDLPAGQGLETALHPKRMRMWQPSDPAPPPSPRSPPPPQSPLTFIPSPPMFVEVELQPVSPPPPVSTTRRSRPLQDDDIFNIINYGSEEDTDESDEDDTTPVPLIPRVFRSYMETPLDQDIADAATVEEVPADCAPTEVDATVTEQPWQLFDFDWRAFPNPPIAAELRRETFSEINVGPTTPCAVPYDIFIEIWDQQIMEHIASETNKYAQQAAALMLFNGNLHPRSRITQWRDTTPDELYVYMGLVLAMGVVVKSRLEEYWSTNPDWPPKLIWWTVTVLLIVAEITSAVSTTPIRRRLRKPGKVSTSVTSSVSSRSSDQVLSASVNRPKIRGRPTVASRKSSAAIDNSVATDDHKDKDGYKIVCYYTNWSQYRTKIGKFTPEDIQPDLCTHIIFAFGWLKKGKLSSFESNDETKDGKTGLYDRINHLKKANPKLKTLLAIGGWSFGTQKFKDMSASRYARQTFIYSAIPYLRDRNFDGLDVDWEYPKGGDDKKNYVLLLKELREAFEAEAQEVKKPRLLLTAAVPVGPDNIKGGYDVPAVASYLDFINVMAYDFHGKWERETGHNAPLYAPSSDSEWRKQLSVDHAAHLWVKLGAPKEKLIIGMPTYGRTFTLSNPNNFKVNSPASGGGKAGEYTKEGGFLAYYEVCEILQNGGTYIWDDEMKVPYAINGDQWVGFDDEKSIRNKMRWIKDNGFGGAMVWTVDMDDFSGTVCGGEVKYPLIGAMREELRGISRGKDAKDVDWASVASSAVIEVTEKPEPIKISLSDVLSKVKKPTKTTVLKINAPALDKSKREPQILCYLTSWSSKRPSAGRFTPENVDASLCTHVIFAFATLKDHKLTEGDKKDAEMYEKVVALRNKNPNLKVMLAIGGWAFGSTPFKELTSNVFRMNQFVYEAIEFLRDYQFNGLDVDWEYPRGADDRAAFVSLLKELRLAFEGEAKTSGQPRLLLSAAVPASFEAIAAGYDVPEVSKYLDYINVMTYDFHGQWERQVGHNSPLFPLESATSYQKKLTVDYSAREWVRQGAPKEKLMIGMPTYGRSFTLINETQFDIGAPASGGGAAGRYTNEAGFMSYYEVCEFLREDNTTLVWDNEQMVPFAYRGNQWVGFDDERSLKTKMAWLKEEGFGGIMVWSIDMDDFRGSCGTGNYPLITAMRQELGDYKVKLEYDGPYESSNPNGQYTTKDPNEVVCEEEDGHISYHPDKADCTHYYMCEGERKHHMPCPSNLVFNPNENVCDWPENVEGCTHHTQAPAARR